MTAVQPPQVATPGASADSALADVWQPLVHRIAGLPFVAREAAEAAADLVRAAAAPGRSTGEHVHLANAYSVALADEQRRLADVFSDEQGWLLPDGRPLVWLSALRNDRPRLQQVRGPQLMLDVADMGRAAGLRHFLLGGSPDVLQALEENLVERYPGIEIVGAVSPPYRPATTDELVTRDELIRASGAQIVWVGLGTPKQDLEVIRLAAALPVLAVAVGAAFDYAAGRLRAAPRWVSLAGLEWLWRLAAEPRRLWKRYTVGNIRFLRAVVEFERLRRSRRRGASSRITVVGQLPPPLHGSAVMTQRLVEALRNDGLDVKMIDRRFSRTIQDVGRVGVRKLAAVPSLVLRFVRAARRSDRVVLLLTTSPGSFVIDRLLLALTRRPSILYIHTVGFGVLADRGRLWRSLISSALSSAERVVVLGQSLISDVAPFVRHHDRIVVVPNTTPVAQERAVGTGHRVLFLSNLLPGKGADVFVRAAQDLVARRPDLPWRFDLAGSGDTGALGELPSQVTVHGPVTGDVKAELFAGADILLMPSTYAMEAQPLVIVEALSYGLPVVAYDTGGIRDLVDAEVGALVASGDERGLVEAVLEVLGDSGTRAIRRDGARNRYESQHSPLVFASAWRSILAETGPRPHRSGRAG